MAKTWGSGNREGSGNKGVNLIRKGDRFDSSRLRGKKKGTEDFNNRKLSVQHAAAGFPAWEKG